MVKKGPNLKTNLSFGDHLFVPVQIPSVVDLHFGEPNRMILENQKSEREIRKKKEKENHTT